MDIESSETIKVLGSASLFITGLKIILTQIDAFEIRTVNLTLPKTTVLLLLLLLRLSKATNLSPQGTHGALLRFYSKNVYHLLTVHKEQPLKIVQPACIIYSEFKVYIYIIFLLHQKREKALHFNVRILSFYDV